MTSTYTGSIKVSIDNTVPWECTIATPDEYQYIKDCRFDTLGVRDWLYPVCVPFRTDRLLSWDAIGDVVLPQTGTTLATCNVAHDFFNAIPSFVGDILTLPIRAVTLLPRVVYNALHLEHPFLTLLKQKGADQKLVQAESLWVEIETLEQNSQSDEYMKRSYQGCLNFSEGVYCPSGRKAQRGDIHMYYANLGQ